MIEHLYKVKKKKALPLFIGLMLAVSGTVIIQLFAGKLFLPEWIIYGIPLLWTFSVFLIYALSRGTLEVTTNAVMVKAGNEIIDQMQIEDIQAIERLIVDESVLAGSARRVSVGRYVVFKDKQGKEMKVNCGAYSEKQIEEVVQYIERHR